MEVSVLSVSDALTEAAKREPELASYYELHRALFELQDEARQGIEAVLELADEEALGARVHQGLPLLAFEQLPLEPRRFARLAEEIAAVLTDYEVAVAVDSMPEGPDEWVDLARRQFEMGQVHQERDEEPEEATLSQVAADLALKPYVAWAADQVMPHVDQSHWRRDYCPACGGAPDFALLDEEVGARRLVCSRCDAQWSYPRVGCPFCGTSDHTQLSYYVGEDKSYRLYVCDSCRRYLKTVDLRETTRVVRLPVERITTLRMDAAAHQEGYE
jgi:FdhE protein